MQMKLNHRLWCGGYKHQPMVIICRFGMCDVGCHWLMMENPTCLFRNCRHDGHISTCIWLRVYLGESESELEYHHWCWRWCIVIFQFSQKSSSFIIIIVRLRSRPLLQMKCNYSAYTCEFYSVMVRLRRCFVASFTRTWGILCRYL